MDEGLIASFGLLLDMIGVVLLLRFGLPSDVGPTTTERPYLAAGDINPVDLEFRRWKWRRYRRGSRAGLSLMILGFFLQAVSNHVGKSVDTLVDLDNELAAFAALTVVSILIWMYFLANTLARSAHDTDVRRFIQFINRRPELEESVRAYLRETRGR